MKTSQPEMTTIIVLCDTCGKFLDIKDGHGVNGTSHGKCPECLEKFIEEIKRFDREQGNG